MSKVRNVEIKQFGTLRLHTLGRQNQGLEPTILGFSHATIVILEYSYSIFSSMKAKNGFLNEIAENGLSEVEAVGSRIWVPYHSFLLSNVLIGLQRTSRCVKHGLTILL